MNNKMAINTYLSTTESKNKLSKQEQRQNHGYRVCFDGCQIRRGWGGKEEELRGLRVQIGSYRIAMGMQSTA